MKNLFIVFFSVFLFACSSSSIEDYQGTTPILKLDEFFNGELIAHGMVLDRNGKLTRRFSAKIIGTWDAEKGTLHEWFDYDDGEKSERIWQLTHLGDGRYQGTANDVEGIATGQAAGSAFYWRYDLEIEYQGDPMTVTLDDWMYLISDDVLLNRSDIIKYGLKVGEVILTIEKQP